MKRMFTIFLLLVGIFLTSAANGQQAAPLSLGDTVKGKAWEMIKTTGKKLYILDFWSTYCASCIKAFPKMEQLKKTFYKEVEIILVNSYESTSEISLRLNSLNERFKKNSTPLMQMPALRRIDGDTILKKLFPHTGVPHHVWLDGNGKVLSVTHGHNATAEHVSKALAGEPLFLAVKKDLKAEGFDAWKQGLIKTGHPALRLAFYSGFIYNTAGLGGGNAQVTDTVNGTFRRSWMNSDVLNLYRSATFNMPQRPRLLVDLRDKQRFGSPLDVNRQDEWRNTYSLSYEMMVPIADKEQIGEILLSDLNYFCGTKFGINGAFEKRKLPALVLVVSEPGKLKTLGGEARSERSEDKLIWTNTPLSSIGSTLQAELEDMDAPLVFINELAPYSSMSVDIKLNGKYKDVQSLKKQLQKHGLDLLQEEREVEVLVVREKVREQ